MIGKIAHLLFQEMSKIKDSILECIPKKTEKYISFSLGGLRFIDSLSVLQASLDSLVKNLPKETFEHIKELAEKKEQLDLFYQKGSIRTSTWIAGKGWRNRTAFRSAR